MERMFPRLQLPEMLALEFMVTFARYEYALKASGFVRGGAKRVDADWDAFAIEVDRHFRRIGEAKFVAAVEMLLSQPPRKQVLRGGRMEWKVAPPDPKLPKAQQALLMVRRVRNNLFHGSKVWSPEYGDRARDVQLGKASLIVLQQSVRLHKVVGRSYDRGVF